MTRKKWVLVAMTALVALALATAGGAGAQSVGQDGYPVGDIVVTPSGGACIGGMITLSGAGMPANGAVAVVMGKDEAGDAYAQLLGITTADGSGNWSLSASVPATVVRDSDGAEVATTPGTWEAAALGEDEMSLSLGSFTVLDCGGVQSTVLPSTGFPTATAGLLGAGILASAAAGLGLVRSRLKR